MLGLLINGWDTATNCTWLCEFEILPSDPHCANVKTVFPRPISVIYMTLQAPHSNILCNKINTKCTCKVTVCINNASSRHCDLTLALKCWATSETLINTTLDQTAPMRTV